MEAPSPSFPGLVNFCLHGLVELTSSSVSADSYQATNLVSTDPSVRSRGFRVEHFIRPPVQLDYEFQLPLNIAYIIVQPDLTASSEMRLELAGSFHTTLTSSDLLKICPYAVIKGNQTTLIFENKSFKMRDGGRACFSTKNILSLPVEGSYMGGSRGSCLDDGMQPVLQPLKYTNVLGKLRHLRVTVNRMSGPKPVAIRSLEVWGYPSNTCSALKLNLLQTSLTAAALKRHSTSSSGVGVKLYRSEKTSPEHSSEQEQEQAVHQQRSLTHNSLHRRSCVDMGLGCNDDSNTKTSCPCSGEDSGRGCGGVLQTVEEEYKQQEPSCRGDVSAVLGVAGCGRCEAPEAFHIKAATSENKKSLKPQQRLGAPHLNGCGHNIQDGEKPAQSGLNNMLPQGKNGNPSPSSELIAHNSDLANDEENSTGSSCGLGPGTAARARQQHQQQQWRRRQQCSEGPTQCVFIEREIPAEFLDKITYDVMHVPMLLPSGYCVDRSTLEKLSNSDALYGRPPTDPFTGIPFSGMSKPSFVPELKLRMDQFLSSTSVSTNPLPGLPVGAQTLGSAKEIAAHLQRVQDRERRGNGKRVRDNADEAVSSKAPPSRKKLRSTPVKDPSQAHQSCSRQGPDCELPWACPPSQSPSYRRSGCEPPIKDQSKEDRIPHHAGAQSSPPPANHSLQLQRDKSQFEQEVAGSLDDALKQLLSDS